MLVHMVLHSVHNVTHGASISFANPFAFHTADR